jgi:protein phosphatase
MVREGILDPVDALTDRRRNILTRALGADDRVRVDVVTAERLEGDRILLCSDGLHGQVADPAIASVLRDEADPADAADRLVGLANAAGGDDNVTVIVIDPDAIVAARISDVSDVPDETARVETVGVSPTVTADPGPRHRRTALRMLLIALLILVIIAVAIATWRWVGSTSPI